MPDRSHPLATPKPGRLPRLLVGILAALCVAGSALAADLDRIRSAGVMSVAIYKNFAPFSGDAGGIDVDIAGKLGEKLGVAVKFLPFDADESMDDDLRNMVWKGSVLGYGPADVMMHVPVQPEFANRNEQVAIFAAYFRDTMQIARNLERVPELRYMSALEDEPVGVEADSLGADLLGSPMVGARVKDVRHYVDMSEAFADLKAGKLGAVLALGSQAQAAMGRVDGFAVEIAPLRGRVPPAGWAFGLAVKADNVELSQALQKAMTELEQEGVIDRIFAAHGVKRLRP